MFSSLKPTQESYMRKLQILIASTTNGRGKASKFRDLAASRAFSALSDLDVKLQGQTGLPDLVELDYKPVVLTTQMNHLQHQDAFIR